MSMKPCQYVIGSRKVDGVTVMKECGKKTGKRVKSSSRWFWKRTPICFRHLQFSTRPPKEWL